MSYVNHNAAANSAPMQAQRSDAERKVPGMGRRGPFKPVEKPVENVYNSLQSFFTRPLMSTIRARVNV